MCSHKRVWGLPYNTHCPIASAFGFCRPLYDELCCRVLKFHFNCLHSPNHIVSAMCRYALTCGRALSPHGRNIIVLCNRYHIRYWMLFDRDNMAMIQRKINVYGSNSLPERYICRLPVIYELLMIKFRLVNFTPDSGFMTNNELNDCRPINYLCTD